jgi:hypothetical protein
MTLAIIIDMARLTDSIRTAQRALGRVGLPEAARALGRSHSWLWRQLKGSSGVVYRESGAMWADIAALGAWLRDNGHPAESEALNNRSGRDGR